MSIFSYVRGARDTFSTEHIEVVDGYEYNQKETVDRITKYWASQYDGDNSDPILGELPFDNIIIGNVEKETEATDFDTKDIEIRPEKPTPRARWQARLATRGLYEHLEDIKFANTLNEICHTRALYGGVLVKKTEDGTKVVPWQNVIVDQSDIMSGTIIERHYYTPAELKEMEGKWENVDDAILTARQQRETDLETVSHDNKTQGHLIEVYEIHGVIERSEWDEDVDELEFERRMIVVAGIDWKAEQEDGSVEEQGIILYNEIETESPYKFQARNKIVGRGLGVGVAESLFDQQTWHNFTLAEQFRAMSIAGKAFFDSDNPKIPDNIMKLDHGTVLKRGSDHSPTTLVNAMPSGLPMYDRLRAELKETAQSITGSYDAVTGQSNVNKPLGVVAIENIEGHSRYEQEREEIGELIEEIIRDWELPEAMKKLKRKDEIYTSFEPRELLEIDEMVITRQVNDALVKRLLNGEVITPDFIEQETMKVKKSLAKDGMKRMVTGIKKLLDETPKNVRISTTSENKNRQAWFQNRVAVLQYIAPEDPRYNAIIDSILDEMGITMEDIEIAMDKNQPQAQKGPAQAPEIAPQEEQAAALQT